MAVVHGNEGGAWVALAAQSLVGRSSACTLRVDEAKASREHARIQFEDGVWSVRDLGSTNGTFVNGERLAAGATRPLSAGDTLGFGAASPAWALVDASPPVAVARRLDDEVRLAAEDGILVLPSAVAPLVSVLEAEDGGWVAEIEGQARPARDGEVLSVAGRSYMLHLPVADASTALAAKRRVGLADVDLGFRVSRDEERVEVSIKAREGTRVLPSRSHHYTWLTVARARFAERDRDDLADAQRGWIPVDRLCDALRIEETRLNVEIHRIRQEVAAAGLFDAPSVIERRRGARQLRLGTARVTIAEMD